MLSRYPLIYGSHQQSVDYNHPKRSGGGEEEEESEGVADLSATARALNSGTALDAALLPRRPTTNR